jgi:hypothetical protein
VRGRTTFLLNVRDNIEVCIYIDTVHMVLLVGLVRFVIVGNLYIMFGLTLNVLEFVLCLELSDITLSTIFSCHCYIYRVHCLCCDYVLM